MKNISILGSTGSIGRNTLDVIRNHKDRFRIVALAASNNIRLLAEQVNEFRPDYVALYNSNNISDLKSLLDDPGLHIEGGPEAVNYAASLPDADLIVAAISGSAGLIPTYEAIKASKNVALANKETLVMGGDLITSTASKNNVHILPIDSEHSAIFQAMQGNRKEDISRVILTASGGPFYNREPDTFRSIKPAEALKHPIWEMGAKVTIDSATMVNKGLEVIEAARLFDLKPEIINVVIHPQSIIHSMVEYRDGSIIAQMGLPDMRMPIQYALSWPERIDATVQPFPFNRATEMKFLPCKDDVFPALQLAFEALRSGSAGTIAYNAADEVAVDHFLKEKLTFDMIPYVIEKVMTLAGNPRVNSLEDILELDLACRRHATEIIENIIR